MKKHFQYLKYLLRHKYFVFVAGLKVGAPIWRLIIHDWSKFLPTEWFAYVEAFYGDYGYKYKEENLIGKLKHSKVMADFDRAWLHHQHFNFHHFQSWILREDSGKVKTLPMPDHFALELVSDWAGAGKAITGKWEVKNWYFKNRDIIVLHDETRKRVEELLGKYF